MVKKKKTTSKYVDVNKENGAENFVTDTIQTLDCKQMA